MDAPIKDASSAENRLADIIIKSSNDMCSFIYMLTDSEITLQYHQGLLAQSLAPLEGCDYSGLLLQSRNLR